MKNNLQVALIRCIRSFILTYDAGQLHCLLAQG